MNVTPLVSLFDRATVAVFDRMRDPSLLFVRVVQGWLFAATGWGKLGNLAGTTEFFTSLGLPLPGVHAVLIGLLELVGGVLLLGGFASRLVAMLLCGNMAVAYLTAHRDAFGSFADFTAAAPYPFFVVSLLVLAFGPGRLSLDAWLERGTFRAAAPAAGLQQHRA